MSVIKKKKANQIKVDTAEVLSVAKSIADFEEEKKRFQAQLINLNSELERLKPWGDIDPESINELESKGIKLSFYEVPKSEYKAVCEAVKTVKLDESKVSVKFLLVESDVDNDKETVSVISGYRLVLPQMSIDEIKCRISELTERIDAIDKQIVSYVSYVDSIKEAIDNYEKEKEFETYATGMSEETLSGSDDAVSVSYFKGYIEAERLSKRSKIAIGNDVCSLIDSCLSKDGLLTQLKEQLELKFY